MNNKKTTGQKKKRQRLLENEAQRHAVKVQLPLYGQIDSHKWESKMEIFRLLSS